MIPPLAVLAAYRNISSRYPQLDSMARLSGSLLHFSSDSFRPRSENRRGAWASEGAIANWKVAAVTFRKVHPGMLLVPSPEATGEPEAG